MGDALSEVGGAIANVFKVAPNVRIENLLEVVDVVKWE